jgi:ABC-type sugar transport system ATPase subunit
MDFVVGGQVKFKGKIYENRTPRESIRRGLALVSEDRKGESIFADRPLNENVAISRLVRDSLFKFLSLFTEQKKCGSSLQQLKTKYSSAEQSIRELSGGNQQKVVLGRVLQIDPDLIILDEPTRGVDVGAKYEIYRILFQLAEAGKALIVISSDLPELTALSDRIIVMGNGKIKGELSRDKFSQASIMQMAVGT